MSDTDMPVSFSTYMGNMGRTRAGATGEATNATLQTNGFGAFSLYTSNALWSAYARNTPFNFMWNQPVNWDETLTGLVTKWTYDPVKYWPNDNQPADDQNPPAQGSQTHSYLQFFAYAPFVRATDLPATGRSNATADGIVELSANTVDADKAIIYYRTSRTKPFSLDESVDLLWATKQNCYKYDPTNDTYDDGRVTDRVQLIFKHAQTLVEVKVKALVDRTKDHTSPAYSDQVDDNTRIFLSSVNITTPDYYPEGILMIAPDATIPTWDYTGLDALKKSALRFGSDVDPDLTAVNNTKDIDNIKAALRYEAPNIPTNRDWDGEDAETGLTDLETAQADFAAMSAGVTATEENLANSYDMFLIPPTDNTRALAVHAVYHVLTLDPQLTLNTTKYYSDVTNDITATLNNDDFHFEPSKQYKLLLYLGLTSVKFEVYVLDESGEYILLSAVVKNWDTDTREVNVE